MTLIEELKSKAGWHGHEHISGLLLKAATEIESLQERVHNLTQHSLCCPRCGKHFHESDVHQNPTAFWRCPLCSMIEHADCRWPLTEESEHARMAKEIESLQKERDELRKEVPTADAIIWRTACNEACSERDDLRRQNAELREALMFWRHGLVPPRIYEGHPPTELDGRKMELMRVELTDKALAAQPKDSNA